jgi:hypothetical protein
MWQKFKRLLTHLFLPQESNQNKAKYLHHDFLTSLIAIMLIVNVSLKVLVKNYNLDILGAAYSISTEELLNNTNAERIKYGLSPLKLNAKLSAAASGKAGDIFAKNYWAHYAPDGTSPWYFFQTQGYQYLFAGENLAKDFDSSAAVVTAWMNSETHRENILKPEYEDVGFAISEGTLEGQPTILVVQLFGKEEGSALAQSEPANIEQTTANPATQPEIAVQEPEIKTKTNLATPQLQEVSRKPLINIFNLQRQMLFVILAGLIVVLSLDLYFVEKKQLFKLSGRNLAHLMFTLLLILSIITTGSGAIL